MARVHIPVWFRKGKEKGFFVRRANRSQSFSQTGFSSYHFTKNGKQVAVISSATRGDVHCFSVNMFAADNYQLGSFQCSNHGGNWFLTHRIIDPDFRGHGLGKLGFRLAEQEARKRGGESFSIGALKKDELSAALSLGYCLSKESELRVRELLNISQGKPLPSNKVLVEMLKSDKVPYKKWNFSDGYIFIMATKKL